ncbi:MAG: DUF2974 domain-containing protein [Clostridia bacterium]|nr:DUF2974 domain-containing protein [Clostridia bacterium]
MANILDYMAWRGDVPFSVSPFNEVDGLVLSELVYADFSGIVPEGDEGITVEEARKRFWGKHTPEEIMARDDYTKMAPFLMDQMADNGRYGGTVLRHFLNIVDPSADIQLACMTFSLPDNTDFVAFRGTDSTIVGWKEDCLLSYLPETAGQRRGVAYMNEHFTGSDRPLRVGGHSKGGNLAVYAAARCNPAIQDRILTVYNNDGPGFLEGFIQSEEYQKILSRIVSVLPGSSLVGTLLEHTMQEHVVKSNAMGLIQHDGFSWQVLGNRFEELDKRSDGSLLTEKVFHKWLGDQTESNRRVFVNTLFGLLESTGKSTLGQIRKDVVPSLNEMRKMLENMPKEDRDVTWNMILQLLQTGTGSIVQEALQDAVQDVMRNAGKEIMSRLESLGGKQAPNT